MIAAPAPTAVGRWAVLADYLAARHDAGAAPTSIGMTVGAVKAAARLSGHSLGGGATQSLAGAGAGAGRVELQQAG